MMRNMACALVQGGPGPGFRRAEELFGSEADDREDRENDGQDARGGHRAS
jgi:hypothetical protein